MFCSGKVHERRACVAGDSVAVGDHRSPGSTGQLRTACPAGIVAGHAPRGRGRLGPCGIGAVRDGERVAEQARPGSEAPARLVGRPAGPRLAATMALERSGRGARRVARGAEDMAAFPRRRHRLAPFGAGRGDLCRRVRRGAAPLFGLAGGRRLRPGRPARPPHHCHPGSRGLRPPPGAVRRRRRDVGRGPRPRALSQRPDRRGQRRWARRHHHRRRAGALRHRRPPFEPSRWPCPALPGAARAGDLRARSALCVASPANERPTHAGADDRPLPAQVWPGP